MFALRPLLLPALLAVLISAGSGCVETRVVHDPWGNLKEMADKTRPKRDRSNRADAPPTEGTWAVLLQRFEGPDGRDRAEALKARLEREAHLPDLWLGARGELVTLYRGQYAHPDVPAARTDLRQTRMVAVNGSRPFADARLVPLGTHARGAADPWDLRAHSGRYSLQIGYYDDAFGPDFREAAELAVRTLRETDDAEAYYYHGPHRSLITVGLFDDHDFRQEGGVFVYGPAIRQAQARYPHNLGNGRTVIEKRGETRTTQASFIVKVP